MNKLGSICGALAAFVLTTSIGSTANAACTLQGYVVDLSIQADRTVIKLKTNQYDQYTYSGFSDLARIEEGLLLASRGGVWVEVRSNTNCPAINGADNYALGRISQVRIGR